MSALNILIGCEFSGRVGDAFHKLGHNVLTCDFLPSESELGVKHYKGDILDAAEQEAWDMALLFPPCTYLCSSGLHWNKRVPERAQKTEEALKFVQRLLELDIPKIALENPVGCISSRIRKPDQMVQPYDYGEDASKKTCLWLKNLPPLKSTGYVEPRLIIGPSGKPLKRWSNQTDSGQSNLGPSPDRWKIRSTTYQGIANAMAEQWGDL